MKLAIDTFAIFQKVGEVRGIEMIKEAGFDGVDFTYYGHEEDSPILGENYREYALKMRALLDEHGLICNQAHAPFSLKYGEPHDFSCKNYRDIVRSIESASILGVENIVVHSITVPANDEGITFEQYNYDYYKGFEPYCEKFGVKISVENLFIRDQKRKCYLNTRLGTPEALSAFVEKLDSPWFNACIDIGHASLTGYEPEDFIRKMKPGILAALHVQDTDYMSDSHTLPFLGNLNWHEIMAALKDTEYPGEFTFEIIIYLKKFPAEHIAEALKFAAATGRYLISL